MKNAIILALSILFFTSLSAKEPFTKQQLLADIDSMYVMINDIHPDMFTNINQVDFEKKLDSIKKQTQDNMSILDFYIHIKPLITSLGDGHTAVSFPWREIMSEDFLHFPLNIEYKDFNSHPKITANLLYPDCNIPVQAKILSINGKSTDTIAKEMFKMVSGEKDYYRISRINIMFWALYSAMYRETEYLIEYMHNGVHHKEIVKGMSYTDRFHANRNISEQNVPKDYYLSLDKQNKIATIHFNRFNDYNTFKAFLDSSFTIISEKKINDLIIDIRNNGGGHSALGDELLQYISPVPFQQYGKVVIKSSDRQAAFHQSMFDLPNSWKPGIDTYYVEELHQIRDNDLRFTGSSYLLTSNSTFSSAADFAWAFKYFNIGTIVGEETGGLAVCFGDIISQTLPNTDLQLSVSHKKFYNYGATDENTHGTIPDYDVPANEAMDYAIDIIIKSRL